MGFLNSTNMKNLMFNLKQRNNLEDLNIDITLLGKLYGLCGIETAHKMPNNWCRLFEKHEFDVLSYSNDLKDYWLKSYGNDLNTKVVQLLFKDLFENMDKFIRNDLNK